MKTHRSLLGAADGEACRNMNHRGAWIVLAFQRASSGPRTPSEYSQVGCNTCLRVWRTKAPYVTELPRSARA